jgi:CBS domain-containing protein
MRVKDVMVTGVAICDPEQNLCQVVELFWKHRCGALPVVDKKGTVLGMLTDRDACIAMGTRNVPASQIRVRDVSLPRFFSCSSEDEVRSALGTMAAQEVRRLPVVDEAGKLKGILSIDDVILNAKAGSQVNLTDVVTTLKAIYAHRLNLHSEIAASVA